MVTPAVLMLCLVIKESGKTTCLREFKTKTTLFLGLSFSTFIYLMSGNWTRVEIFSWVILTFREGQFFVMGKLHDAPSLFSSMSGLYLLTQYQKQPPPPCFDKP